MGLDSWLWLRRTVTGLAAKEEKNYTTVCQLLNTTPAVADEYNYTRLGGAVLEVAYWRNAYVIHAWMEDCLRYTLHNHVWSAPLQRGELQRLVSTCETLLADPTQTQLLPQTIEYHAEQHAAQLEHTHTMLTAILNNPQWASEAFEFVYQANW